MANTLNRIISYFDLQSAVRGNPVLEGKGGPSLAVFPQYVALVLGIIVQPYLEQFRKTGSLDLLDKSFLVRALFSLVIGLAIFPMAYRKAFDPGQPIFVQFCVIFLAGLGWQSLFNTAPSSHT